MLISGAGEFLIESVGYLQSFVQLAIGATMAIVIGLLVVRYLPELLKLNPFGQTYQALRRPTDELIYHMRRSHFYTPLRRTLGFDPAMLMVLISLAILWYVVSGVLQNLFFIGRGLGLSLIAFGSGALFGGVRYLTGTVLLAILFFLMALMTIVFVNWLFGLFQRAGWWALDRLTPLLRVFEFGGTFAGWSFMILWIAISFASTAVQAIFF
jgi:hypothetical protein